MAFLRYRLLVDVILSLTANNQPGRTSVETSRHSAVQINLTIDNVNVGQGADSFTC